MSIVSEGKMQKKSLSVKVVVPEKEEPGPSLKMSVQQLSEVQSRQTKSGVSLLTYGVSNFASCCGIDIISSLRRSDFNRELLGAVPIDEPNLIATCIDIRRSSNRSCIMAATIAVQESVVEVLKALGFEPVTTTVNKNTRNTITVWKVDVPR